MIKRIFLYLAVASLLFVGADVAVTQQLEMIPMDIDFPYRPMGLTVDTQPATWTTLEYGTHYWVFEDVGEYGRVIGIDPGNAGGAVALTYIFDPLLGPSGAELLPTPPHVGHFTINSDPAGFLGNSSPQTNGVILAPYEESLPFIISELCWTNFNINFNYSTSMAEELPGTYTGTLTFTLAAI